jgi:TatD DNase family protein
MSIFDTHCHYNLEPLASNWEEHWKKAQDKGVQASIVVGTEPETSEVALSIANQDLQLFAAIGIHPNYVSSANLHTQSFLTTLLINQKESGTNAIVAIGETGLDYFRLKRNESGKIIDQIEISNQQAALREHLECAAKHELPVILHVRDQLSPESEVIDNAYWDTLHITADYPNLTYILHCLSGPLVYLQYMLKRQVYASIAANCTYPSAHAIRELITHIPQDKLLIETDAPFLAPQTYRGQICEPWMITQTASFLATEHQISLERVLENSYSCFNIPRP